MVNWVELAELIAKLGGALLILAAIVKGIAAAIKHSGRAVGKFVDDKVLPPINKLASSVDELAARTHENTVAIGDFAEEQRHVNLHMATQLAKIQGHLGLES